MPYNSTSHHGYLRWREAGIEQVRIGTKEMAFFRIGFDSTFLDMLDNFHAAYPACSCA